MVNITIHTIFTEENPLNMREGNPCSAHGGRPSFLLKSIRSDFLPSLSLSFLSASDFFTHFIKSINVNGVSTGLAVGWSGGLLALCGSSLSIGSGGMSIDTILERTRTGFGFGGTFVVCTLTIDSDGLNPGHGGISQLITVVDETLFEVFFFLRNLVIRFTSYNVLEGLLCFILAGDCWIMFD